MAYRIDQAKVRDRLSPRIQEPYWGVPLARGRALGMRKIAADRASWIARMRPEGGARKYEYTALGAVSREFDYEAAKQAALEWFRSRDAGVDVDIKTVAEVCREYITELRRKNGDPSANDAEKRFERTIYEEPLGAIRLDKLKTPSIKEWRDWLLLPKGERPGLSKGSANRTMTALKAALNLAVTNGRVDLRVAQFWRNVKPYPNASARRTLFLDLRQRRKLLEAATGGLRNLVEAAALTGARAGELVSAIRAQFDARLKTIEFKGKTGPRTIPLSSAALALFKRLAKSKLPAARLLTRDDGKPWGHSDWDELVRDAAKAAKLPKGTCLYTLRHSYITQAITDGMTTLDVARLCGTSVGMIEKHYGHLVASSARARLAKVTML
jgi:site-specific recombinase XerD